MRGGVFCNLDGRVDIKIMNRVAPLVTDSFNAKMLVTTCSSGHHQKFGVSRTTGNHHL